MRQQLERSGVGLLPPDVGEIDYLEARVSDEPPVTSMGAFGGEPVDAATQLEPRRACIASLALHVVLGVLFFYGMPMNVTGSEDKSPFQVNLVDGAGLADAVGPRGGEAMLPGEPKALPPVELQKGGPAEITPSLLPGGWNGGGGNRPRSAQEVIAALGLAEGLGPITPYQPAALADGEGPKVPTVGGSKGLGERSGPGVRRGSGSGGGSRYEGKLGSPYGGVAQGSGRGGRPGSRDDILEEYLQKLQRKIEENKYYPGEARRAGMEGAVRLVMGIRCDGRLLTIQIDQGSTHDPLDEAALKTIKEAEPLPPPPREICTTEIQVAAPMIYRLKR